MSIESDNDRLEMLKTLGELVSVDGNSVYGIFENAFLELGFDSAVESSDPMLTVRASDIPGLQRRVVVKVGSESYRVAEIQPDGTGMTVLKLTEL